MKNAQPKSEADNRQPIYTMDVELAGETVQLYQERAMYWAAQKTLFIADTHFGKAAHLRAAGVPVPEGHVAADLQRLTAVLAHSGAERLIILGDFFHARGGKTPACLEPLTEWRQSHSRLEILNVRGNHDRAAGDPPAELGIIAVNPPYPLGAFVGRHEPGSDSSGYCLCGHLHPGVRLVDAGRPSLYAQCFLFRPNHGVLPAFGSFTGRSSYRTKPGERIFIVGTESGQIVELPAV